jgi:protein translocase SecG subunit
MNTVLLIVHLFVTLALIGVVLIQRSEGGGLGIGTSPISARVTNRWTISRTVFMPQTGSGGSRGF